MKWFIERFPEDLFPCNGPEYISRVLRGSVFCKTQSLFVCGLIRDAEAELYWNIHRISNLVSYFRDYRIFLYENDSSDRTPQLLQSWADKDPKMSFLSERHSKIRHEQDKSFDRTVDMAYYRNKYVQQLNNWSGDFVLVYDFDLKGGFSYEGIFDSFYHFQNNPVDAIGSNGLYFDDNGRRLYFDSWASRGEVFGDNANELILERGSPLVEVDSCGGGLLLYRRDAWLPFFEYKAGDCDHPTLHKQMKQYGKRIFLNPSQITLYNKTRYCI